VRACVVSHLDAKYWEATRRAERLVRIPQAVQIRPAQHGTPMSLRTFGNGLTIQNTRRTSKG